MIVALAGAAVAVLLVEPVRDVISLEYPSRGFAPWIVATAVVGCLAVEAVHRWVTPYLVRRGATAPEGETAGAGDRGGAASRG